ncbi:WYL domain-containing protein [Pseudomonas sp. CFBP 13719]|uniref:WYL domain-containing protein n=1 Tax=Pseudomonas sp. CFBP 13719 TaxID=2775303 RepID=UPI001785BB27|nr:WYL domain-containing protein [Pseudomonas sp. CFBP 13719]MBD8614953.1 WYL domain-containing protein [Pseudomonas putida]MBD8681364.1 WYL domain-containing protein [Pseudomonas sp. CFBP 13719]
MHPAIQDLSPAQQARLIHLEMNLRFMGGFSRHVLADEQGMHGNAITRDIKIYRTIAPDNLLYDVTAKHYRITDRFSPIIEVEPSRALAWLTHRQGRGDGMPSAIGVPFSAPLLLCQPSTDTIASISRAIHGQHPILIEYESLRERSERVIVPYALVNNGLRWHVRAYDRKARQFRDFVLTRILCPQVLTREKMEPYEQSHLDAAWSNSVELKLVPHPDRPRPEVTRLDYGMSEGPMTVTLRWAEVGYTLRQWNVDCSADHHMKGVENRLWLANHEVLDAIPNALLAPGFKGSTGDAVIATDQ